ncbi:MAG TPA: flippase [Thermoleophilaceae bacterium]
MTAVLRRQLQGGAAGDAKVAGGHEIASNVAIQLVARTITMAISIVTVSLTARTLHPTGYGVWTGITSFIGLFEVFTDLGFTTAAMQRMAAEPERESEWLGALAGARTALSFAVIPICAIAVPIFLSANHHAHAVAFILMITILTTGAATLMSVFQSRLRAGIVLALTVAQSLIWLGAVVVLAVGNADVVQFTIVYTVLVCLISAWQVQITRRHAHIDWRAGRKLWRPLARVAVPLGVSGLMVSVYWQIDSVLLLQIAGAKEAGFYGAAYGFLGPLTFLPAAVMGSFFPVLAAVYGRDPDRARRLVQIAAEAMAIISVPVLAGAIALSVPIVHFLYGPGFHRSAGLLPILMIAFVSICFGSLSGFLAPVLDLQKRLAVYSALGAVLNIGLNAALIPSYGAFGSAWATVATEILTMTLMLATSLHALRLRIRLGRILRTFAVAAAMTGVMELLKPFGFILAGIVGLLFYAGALFAVRVIDVDEVRALRASRRQGPVAGPPPMAPEEALHR